MQDYEEGEWDTRPAPLRTARTPVVNVTSKTYGTDVNTDDVANLIFANTTLPCKVTDTFLTMYDNQSAVAIKVSESDFTNPETDRIVKAKFCNILKEEVLPLTKNWPKGTPVSVTFELDHEGILKVYAYVDKDKLNFELQITGVKSQEEISKSREIISKAVIE
ncbi:MAG: Hsp70 family protein, partial [Duncaniella sp.]|nr:Hsp70 family protein [Duncaniella sp.]